MKRVEEFRIIRAYRRKCIFIFVFFLVVTLTGILVTDYCINSIIKNENKVEILRCEKEKNSTIKLNIFDKTLDLYYGGVLKDFNSLKNKLFG